MSDSQKTTWYWYDNEGQRQGPISGGKLKGLAKTGRITPGTMIETESGKAVPAKKIQGLTFIPATSPDVTPVPSSPAQPPPVPVHAPSPFTSVPVPILPVVQGTESSVTFQPLPVDTDAEQILFEASPPMFRNTIGGILVWTFVLMVGLLFLFVMPPLGLCLLLISAFVFAVSFFRSMATKLTVTNHRSTLRKGILTKRTTELLHEHVCSVNMSQGIFDRFYNVGRIDISTAASGIAEISVSGMRDPEKIKQLIQQYQRRR